MSADDRDPAVQVINACHSTVNVVYQAVEPEPADDGPEPDDLADDLAPDAPDGPSDCALLADAIRAHSAAVTDLSSALRVAAAALRSSNLAPDFARGRGRDRMN